MVNSVQKFRLFSIRIIENLKIGYFDSNFKKTATSHFPRSTKWDLRIDHDICYPSLFMNIQNYKFQTRVISIPEVTI